MNKLEKIRAILVVVIMLLVAARPFVTDETALVFLASAPAVVAGVLLGTFIARKN